MRTLIITIDSHFADIDERQRKLLAKASDEDLFWSPASTADSLIVLSVGGAVLRSAAMVEQACLGLTRRLWDDPFEWTLPEMLSTHRAILAYLDEVANVRRSALNFLRSDDDLGRQLPAPEKLKPILQVLVEAIGRAEVFLGRGETVAIIRGGVNDSVKPELRNKRNGTR